MGISSGLSSKEKNSIRKFLIWLIVAISYVGFIKYALPIVWPFVVAALLAQVIYPIANFLKNLLGLGKGIASAIILLLIILIFSGGLFLLCIGVFEVFKNFFVRRDVYGAIIYDYVNKACIRVENLLHIEGSDGELARTVIDNVAHAFDTYVDKMAARYMGEGMQVAGLVADGLLAFAITYVSCVLFVKYYEDMCKSVKGNELLNGLSTVIGNAKKVIGAYIKAQGLIMIITGVICSLTLYFIGYKNPIIMGCIIGAMDALPMLGVGIVLIPWSVIKMVNGSYVSGALLIGAFIICTVIREIVEPKLIGNKIGVHPIVILISLYVGYKLFGLFGFILGPIGYIIIDCLTEVILDKTANLK